MADIARMFYPDLYHGLEDQRQFPLEDEDVVVVGFPKSGTSWIQVMLTNLYDDWGNHELPLSKVPSLHGYRRKDTPSEYYGYDASLELKSPRLLKSHLWREYFPERWPEHGKVVHITRNPKDVCVSFYFEVQDFAKVSDGKVLLPTDFDGFVDKFAAGEVAFSPFVDSVASWWNYDHPNLCKLVYEDIRHDPRAAVEKMVEFIGKPVDKKRIADVAEKGLFENMKDNDYRFQVNHPNLREGTDSPFVRKGKIGGWRDYLTLSQSEVLDREVVAPLEDQGIHLNYG
jgi:hypothetical protein